MRVINLFGAPCAGKSTTRAFCFSQFKLRGLNIEEVTEFAKDCVWEERNSTLTDQFYISAKQNHRIHRLEGKVDFVITDSPILLGLFYSNNYTGGSKLNDLLLEIHNSHDNINIFLERPKNKVYNPKGRLQTEEESNIIGWKIKETLVKNGIDFYTSGDYNKDGEVYPLYDHLISTFTDISKLVAINWGIVGKN